MSKEILDDSQTFPLESSPAFNILKSISSQLGLALCSFILYFSGYSIYLTAELGIGIITLAQFAFNSKSSPFGQNKPIAILQFLGASIILVGIFFQVFPYPTATILQSLGLAILILYFFIWVLWYDKQGYLFQLLKLLQGICIASFCWAIRGSMTGEAGIVFLFSFVASIGTLLLMFAYYIRTKNIHIRLLIHLPLVIWVLFSQLAFICTKLF